jgi:hypothetical protein
LFKITIQQFSWWHFHVYMYYNPNFGSSLVFFYLFDCDFNLVLHAYKANIHKASVVLIEQCTLLWLFLEMRVSWTIFPGLPQTAVFQILASQELGL